MNVELVHALQSELDKTGTCWWQRDGDGVRMTRYLLGYILVFQRYHETGWEQVSWKSTLTEEAALQHLLFSRCAFVLDELVYLRQAA